MIPTQPGMPIPPWPNGPADPFQKGWNCPHCGQYVGDMQYHLCSGTNPKPIGTGTIETLDWGTNGMMSDIMMYGDFKKLFRKDTLAIFRERFINRLSEIEAGTPAESGFAGFGLDVIEDIFDDVAKGINFNSDV